LKAQLFSSFGLAAFVSLFVVVISSCYLVSYSGQKLIHRSNVLMVDQVKNRLVSSSELFAVAGRLQFAEETLEIMVEAIRDRIAGYPTMEGWEIGKYVPFEADVEGPDGTTTKQRVYPLNQPPVPLDWQITRDIEVDGIDDPFLNQKLKDHPTAISSTKSAHYRIPGGFYSEASALPMSVTMDLLKDDGLYQSTGDLSVMLKSLYESLPEALTIEINFFNGGSGTTLQFPATATDDETFVGTYVTEGCDWMNSTINPYTGRIYASESMCAPKGTVVPLRLRNPMESLAVKSAIEHTSMQFDNYAGESNAGSVGETTVPPTNSQRAKRDKVQVALVKWEGPYISRKDNKNPILSASKVVYDRVTGELIGVVTIEFLESGLAMDLQRRTLDDDSDLFLVMNGGALSGTIVGTTPGAQHKVFEKLPEFDKIASNLQKDYYDRIPEWEEWRNATDGTIPEPEPLSTNYFTSTDEGGFLVSVPIPPIPKYPWDEPNYVAISFAVQKIPPTIFGEIDYFEDRVRKDIKKSIVLCVLLGVFGLAIVLCILAVMSNVLTRPLTWLNIVARKVINNDAQTGSRRGIHREYSYGDAMIEKNRESKRLKEQKKKQNVFSSSSTQYFSEGNNEGTVTEARSAVAENPSRIDSDLEVDEKSDNGFVNFDYHPKVSTWCTLSTELLQLLEAFRSMIHGFSGDGVSEVAEPVLCEIQNSLTWQSDFSKLYEGHTKARDSFKKLSSMRQISGSTRATTIGSNERDDSLSKMVSVRQISDSTHCTTIGLTDNNSVHPQDGPSFCSSFFHDQDISEEFPSHLQDTSENQLNHDNEIIFPKLPSISSHMIVPAPIKLNLTSTLGAPKFDLKPMPQNGEKALQKLKTVCFSRLFWWIVVLMALPVFVTCGVIGIIVSSSILVTLPETWKESAKQNSNKLEIDAMRLIADRKAAIVVNLMRGPARDVYTMTRITNWLVFGGIQRSNVSINLDSTSESCKKFPENECPSSLPCSCDWEYGRNAVVGSCDIGANNLDSRYLQKQWFEVQKTDSDPVTGSRRSSPSFPASLDSPQSTVWWKNISSLPGSEAGSTSASGYKTLYDRVVVSSACAVFNFPIYNYPSGTRNARTSFGGYIAFADDGLVVGWTGCDDWHSSASKFVSTFENGAPLIDDDLCADGKYGYDPRCQGWYAQGRENYLQNFIPAHVTPPYRNALSGQITQTFTSPIANPKTGEYVGQVALDFNLNYERIVKMLDEDSSLTFMITPFDDILGGDTVVSPGNETGWASEKIEDLIFKSEPNDINRDLFKREVLPLMKAGKRGDTRFLITKKDDLEEEICLYYAPVIVPLGINLRPDDFSSGETMTDHLIYSLGVGKPCDEIKRPYDVVEDAVNEDMLSQQEIFIAIIVSSTVFFIIFSVFAATNIAFPMIKLSNIVQNVKRGEYDSIPPLKGGCREVRGVYNTFAKLNKIVKVSNTSFFSGKLDMAHHFVSDALVLYRKINDRKAIGVTCNNLANTLFAMQYENIDTFNCCDSGNACYANQALALYDEALVQSQQDFDRAEGDIKVDYAIQLSDRLFNRGLYFLFIDGLECAPENSRERGYNDITFSRNLHADIRHYLIENKQLFSKASQYFSRLLRRINCLAAFYDDFGLRIIWDARALLDEANQLMSAASDASLGGNFCPLFQEVNKFGRQQQLESLEILLSLKCKDNLKAAKTGMRMLVEDVNLLESAFVRAAEALLRFMKEGDESISFSKRPIESARDEFRTMAKSCKKESFEIGKNAVFVLEICPSQWKLSNEGTHSGEFLNELNNQCLWLYDNALQDDDQIGIISNTVSDVYYVEIGSKEENEGRQRSFLDDATSDCVESPSNMHRADSYLSTGLQMLIDSSMSLQSDSYIVWVIDGYPRYEKEVLISLRDKIEQLNQKRSYQIHVLIIGLNHNCHDNVCSPIREEKEEHEWMNAEEIVLAEIGSVSKNSVYLNANSEEELTSTFQCLSSILRHNRRTSEFISFLTMEKF